MKSTRQMLFPDRYNCKVWKERDSLDNSEALLTKSKVAYGSNLLHKERRLCAFSSDSCKLSKLSNQLKTDLF